MPALDAEPRRRPLPRRRLAQFNPSGRARRNVAHHYDIDGAIYDLFLDRDRQYSCAYFTRGRRALEEAQLAKKRHIAAKLAIAPGQRVLDIGSGWGGLGALPRQASPAATSPASRSAREQLKIARERAASARASPRRALRVARTTARSTGRFDRIVSVGMFEHVGVNHYGTYFRKVRDLLADDGVALIHTIGRSEPPAVDQSLHRQIHLPRRLHPGAVGGGRRPSSARASSSPTSRSCGCTTPRRCAPGASASSPTGTRPPRILDERFCRMWEFYLAGSEAAFRYQNLVVFQIQLAKRIDALPITRDYMLADEHRLRRARERSTRDRAWRASRV